MQIAGTKALIPASGYPNKVAPYLLKLIGNA